MSSEIIKKTECERLSIYICIDFISFFDVHSNVHLRPLTKGRSSYGPLAYFSDTLVLFYKQHMIKKTSWTFLDFIQSLLIFVA